MSVLVLHWFAVRLDLHFSQMIFVLFFELENVGNYVPPVTGNPTSARLLASTRWSVSTFFVESTTTTSEQSAKKFATRARPVLLSSNSTHHTHLQVPVLLPAHRVLSFNAESSLPQQMRRVSARFTTSHLVTKRNKKKLTALRCCSFALLTFEPNPNRTDRSKR